MLRVNALLLLLAHLRQYSMQKMSKKKFGSVFSEQGIEKETAATKFVIMRLKPQDGGFMNTKTTRIEISYIS